MPKATHILHPVDGDDCPLRGPISVYGEEDLQRRLAAADELGVTVRIVPIDEAEEG